MVCLALRVLPQPTHALDVRQYWDYAQPLFTTVQKLESRSCNAIALVWVIQSEHTYMIELDRRTVNVEVRREIQGARVRTGCGMYVRSYHGSIELDSHLGLL